MAKADDRNEREESAIRNYPQLVRKYARLLEVTQQLVSTLELQALLDSIVEAAKELTECEAASLLLFDPQTNHLYFEAATGNLIDGALGTAIPVESSIAGWVFSSSEPLVVDDALRDPRFFREVDVLNRFQTRTILGVPLRTKDKAFGVIEAVNKLSGTFDEDDVRVLQTLAAQAAIAIENTRLFQQSDLIAEMVHELRTPLGALTAAAHLLQRPDLPEDQRNNLSQTIYKEVERLNGMAADFLELARLESGRVRFVREPVHLGGLIGECIEILRPQADELGITLESDLDASLVPVPGDRNRLKQVFLNLLTNAIKYNKPNGSVRIVLTKEGDQLVAAVTDKGKGIPADSLPHIFERFYRVPDLEGHVGGTGLGLAIAKRITEAHQGTIDLRSDVGVGSTFTIRLPAGSPSAGYDTRPIL
ncbi:MAG TPA: ATP-binding protein [Anaerolineales bacterium]